MAYILIENEYLLRPKISIYKIKPREVIEVNISAAKKYIVTVFMMG